MKDVTKTIVPSVRLTRNERIAMKILLWLLLLVLCWPLALFALILYPIIWLLLIPFRLIGITVIKNISPSYPCIFGSKKCKNKRALTYTQTGEANWQKG
jgi:hypothetical protein